ncbi:alpha/beta hydrolase family protein [Actinomadura pelletieri DSM 43383]|uniref:Alpha/beta hydrolase family protein n=1 Tax=Actinomadura pelletieri DSM 43383 TaxID=1120940 RepID=A0A495QBQ0_9ACTN|nr:alpha/beta fold hydrolase [Actinomadura pelletieri]RKS69112.1 alpha/beta hydrolase family protein [Actinomadura pelletieri DSM 43383]
MERVIPRFTFAGVKDVEISTYPVTTEDGLGLQLTRFLRAESDDVVLLVHGLTSSSDLFIMPEIRNLASHLLDNGFTDVWALDFRMSGRYPYDTETHHFNLDDVALYDFPPALTELRRHIGDRRVHVIGHCLGAMAFAMSVFAGIITDIATLTCNSVSLTPRVPAWSKLKLGPGAWFLEYVVGLPFLDPRFGQAPRFTRPWMLSRAVSLFHGECNVRACHMQSFQWGAGKPAMYEHTNLLPETHARVADICTASGLSYYRHVHKMIKAGRAVRFADRDSRYAALPRDYLAGAADVETSMLLLAPSNNRVFTDSNVHLHRILERVAPGRHEAAVLPGYGHLDPLIGKNAHLDVFPHIVDFLKRHGS